jgi:hypothetical protein
LETLPLACENVLGQTKGIGKKKLFENDPAQHVVTSRNIMLRGLWVFDKKGPEAPPFFTFSTFLFESS